MIRGAASFYYELNFILQINCFVNLNKITHGIGCPSTVTYSHLVHVIPKKPKFLFSICYRIKNSLNWQSKTYQ